MINSAFKLFCSIYVLLAEKHNEKTEELNLYLSDANPFIWNGEKSWDPVVFEEFQQKFNKQSTLSSFGLLFAKTYFAELDNYYIFAKELFASISDVEYISSMERISNYSYDEMKSLYGVKTTN